MNRHVRGMEALLRLPDLKDGFVSPDYFSRLWKILV
jgi:EAL domain-containing protein (putative c-di-GMP-specific phosphodiesterase class I)